MRKTWDETWQEVAAAVAGRSSCTRRQVGAVIVDRTNRIVATGYNGPPAGLTTTNANIEDIQRRFPSATVVLPKATCETSCPRSSGEISDTHGNCIAIHAEANALLFCDRREREGGTLYTTTVPCYECAKLIANSGLVKVVYRDNGEGDEHLLPKRTVRILEDSGVGVVRYA